MLDALIALIFATLLLLGAPGPAPLALAACGGIYGFRCGVPFLLGILAGLAIAIVLGAAGLAVLFEVYPASRSGLQVLGALYIGYLAYKIAAAPIGDNISDSDSTPPGFRQGLILNLLNPKVYAIFLALFSHFLLPLGSQVQSIAATAVIAYGVAIGVDVAWLALGQALSSLVHHPVHARTVRVVLAILMLVTVLLTFLAPGGVADYGPSATAFFSGASGRI